MHLSYYQTFPARVHPDFVDSALRFTASRFRRKTEEKLRQAQKMEAVGNLTGGMAHDFNNLLAIVIGNLDLAIPLQPNGGEAAAHLHKALGVAVRGAELTRRLLAFARRQPLQPKAIDVNGLIAELTKLLSRTLGENIEIALDLEADVAPVVADPAQLEAALVNLSTNARDAMPAGGRLLIVTSNRTLDADYAAQHADAVPGDYVMIAVRDTGTGMPPEVMARVFEPFFTTKEVGKGSGLGLSMVFGFIRQSGGHTTVYSEPGIGTTFRLYLPRAATLPDQAPIVMPAAAGRAAGETILAVEDNEALRQLVIRQLTDLGYRVIEADGVAAALKVLERQPVDLLFSDVVMPGTMNGFDLAEWVPATRPGVKVLLTSGFPDARMDGRIDSSHDVADGSPRILGKPYCKEDLARALRDLLDNHHPETPPQA